MHPVLGLQPEHGAPDADHGRGAAGVVLVDVAAPGQEGVKSPEEGLLVAQLAGLVTGHSGLNTHDMNLIETKR